MKAKCAPPNSIIFVLDPSNVAARIPTFLDGQLISFNEDCISIGTQFETVGETTIFLDHAENIDPGVDTKFEGYINTPNKEIAVMNSHNKVLVNKYSIDEKTLLRVYANDNEFPDLIIIAIL